MRKLLVVGLLASLACTPSQFDPAAYGTVKVAFGPDVDGSNQVWRDDQLAALRDELHALRSLGPDWVEVSEGDADVVVRPFAATSCSNGAGSYFHGHDFVEIDPTANCAPGYSVLQRTMGHELMHWYTDHRWGWIGHICQAHERTDCHPVIHGVNDLLSADLQTFASGDDWTEAFDPSGFVDPSPQSDDLKLFAYCAAHPGGCS